MIIYCVEIDETLVLVSKENESLSEINVWNLCKEGLKHVNTLTINSCVASCVKYNQNKLIVGLVNGYVHIYEMQKCELEAQFQCQNDSSAINQIKINDCLIVSNVDLKIYFVSLTDHQTFNSINLQDFVSKNEKIIWEANELYFVVADSKGFVHVFNNYEKVSSLQVSIQCVNHILFFKQTNLILFSNDCLLNYIDLLQLFKENEKEEILSISNIYFGKKSFLISYFNSNSILIAYENYLNGFTSGIELEESIDVKFGSFVKNDDAFIGAVSLDNVSVWSDKRVTLMTMHDENILSLSSCELLVCVLTTKRQFLINTDDYTVSMELSLAESPLKKIYEKRIKTYFTKNNAFIIYEVPSTGLIAFNILKKCFTSYCYDGTNKSQKTGRYEALKTRHGTICSTQSEILILSKGNILIWNPTTEKSFHLNETLPHRILKKELLAAQLRDNVANYSSVPYFVTYLKHSLRLYDDIPAYTDDLINSQISACAVNYNGSVCCTGDQFGFLIFWYRKAELNKKFKKITTYESVDYAYYISKAHNSQVRRYLTLFKLSFFNFFFKINLLNTFDQSEFLVSASTDRTIKIWNMENATCLCSVYTHLIISQVYFDYKTNLLLATASKLGKKKIMAFKLHHRVQDTT